MRNISTYTLYSTFYEHWIIREHHRGSSVLSMEDIFKLHSIIALELYKVRGKTIKLSQILSYIPNVKGNITEDTAFWAILLKRKNFITNDFDIIRFWHETLVEYIIANQLITHFVSGDFQLEEALSLVYHNEINVFVRGALDNYDNNVKRLIYNNLCDVYYNNLVNSISTIDVKIIIIENKATTLVPEIKPEAERKREQVLYYIGRLGLDFYPDIIDLAYRIENNWLLKRIAALGAILFGNEDIEKDYIENLIPESLYDTQNRSVQLIYFGDAEGEIGKYTDDNIISWGRVRRAIYQRLQKSTYREQCLRWWDLRTLFSFYNSRVWKDAITKIDIEIVKDCIIDFSNFSEKRKSFLQQEKTKLLIRLEQSYNSINGKD